MNAWPRIKNDQIHYNCYRKENENERNDEKQNTKEVDR